MHVFVSAPNRDHDAETPTTIPTGVQMNITLNTDASPTTIALEGRLDTLTSPQLETELAKITATELEFDFTKLDYISSAGLRVLLGTQKRISAAGGKMTIRNVCPAVMDVFNITGFSDILTIN